MVDHADEEAAALVAPVLARQEVGGVAEGLEEHALLDVAGEVRAGLAVGEEVRAEGLAGVRRRRGNGELPEICVREADHAVRECSDDILRLYRRSLSGGTQSLRGRAALPCRRRARPRSAAAARVAGGRLDADVALPMARVTLPMAKVTLPMVREPGASRMCPLGTGTPAGTPDGTFVLLAVRTGVLMPNAT